jgi:hypothetical protein
MCLEEKAENKQREKNTVSFHENTLLDLFSARPKTVNFADYGVGLKF